MCTFDQRLLVLERELLRSRRVNRLLALGLVSVACFAGALGNTPAAPAPPTQTKKSLPPKGTVPGEGAPQDADRVRTVEAHEFVLLDPLGRSRAKMVATADGPALSMFDEEGQKRLELSCTGGAAGLRIFDAEESAVVSLQLPKNSQRAQLEIHSPQGTSQFRASGVAICDSAETQRMEMVLINGNFPVIGINSAERSDIPSVEINSGSLKLYDDRGSPTFSVFASEKGSTLLNLRHPAHERTLQISTGSKDHEGPEIAFFAPANKDGTGGLLPYLQLGLDSDHHPYVHHSDRDGKRTSLIAR